jgi:glutamyl-tRNA synthetase
VLVWEAFRSIGWQTDGSTGIGVADTPGLPVFAHLPLLVNEQRKKISKRRDKVAVEEYRDQGYLPEAFVNYLALLGWSPPGGEEIFDTDQLIEWFHLEDVNHSPAFFDVAKLTHLNGEYVRALPVESFIAACEPWLRGEQVPWADADFDPAVFARLAPLVQERVAVLGEVTDMVDFLFLARPAVDGEAWDKAVAGDSEAVAILSAAIEAYAGLADDWTSTALHAATLAVAEGVGRKLGKAQAPIRVAVTGRRVGLPLFESLEVLGPDRTLDRLADAVRRVEAGEA